MVAVTSNDKISTKRKREKLTKFAKLKIRLSQRISLKKGLRDTLPVSLSKDKENKKISYITFYEKNIKPLITVALNNIRKRIKTKKVSHL
jgi:hypothetical protein